ncbi:MAG: hypothetical protein KME22_09015 [Hassallia sp. WJT32-NPBG1]|jgi:hypothetical protein|nr:hypothetical protein [Hassallia sp. WJT32-NPBG1]
MIEIETYKALEIYAMQTNFFLDFVKVTNPELSDIECIEVATLTLEKLMLLIAEKNSQDKNNLVNNHGGLSNQNN